MRTALQRRAVPTRVAEVHDKFMFPAPVRGWIANESLAGSSPLGALRMENMFPTQTGVRLRGGLLRHSKIGDNPVTALFSYISGFGNQKMFAADQSAIYDVTARSESAAGVVGGLSDGNFSTAQFETAGGDFLYALNDSHNDYPYLYDGSTWKQITIASEPALTGIDPRLLSQAWTFRSRLFFVQFGSMFIWYLPVDSIAGVARRASLQGVFQKGGSVLFGATWSLDAGDGVDDKCVIVSTLGEVAVYEGSDPETWSLAGRYDVGIPLGKNAWEKVGGDLLILTADGIVPISAIVTKDPAALFLAAVTRNIEPEWRTFAQDRQSYNWQMAKWPQKNMGLVTVPTIAGGVDPFMVVVNLETGAWAKYTGWDARSITIHEDWAYIGTNSGTVLMCEVSGTDEGTQIDHLCIPLWSHLKSVGSVKTVKMARVNHSYSLTTRPKVSGAVNYKIEIPDYYPGAEVLGSLTGKLADDTYETLFGIDASDDDVSLDSYGEIITDTWDSGLWDDAIWDYQFSKEIGSRWMSIGKTGFVFTPIIQFRTDQQPTPIAELISVEVTYEGGELVV